MNTTKVDSLVQGVNGLNSIQKSFENLAKQSEQGYNPANLHQIQSKTKETTNALMQQLFNLGTEMISTLQTQGDSIKSLTSNLEAIQTVSPSFSFAVFPFFYLSLVVHYRTRICWNELSWSHFDAKRNLPINRTKNGLWYFPKQRKK